MKVKLFFKKNPLRARASFEDEINVWLAENKGIKIVDIKKVVVESFIFPAVIYVSIWYEDEQ